MTSLIRGSIFSKRMSCGVFIAASTLNRTSISDSNNLFTCSSQIPCLRTASLIPRRHLRPGSESFVGKATIDEKETEDRKMTLKVYVDRMSQPSRAILILLKSNGVAFEEMSVDLFKGEQSTPEFKAINPMGQVPAIEDDGGFKLFESHAILKYICSKPGVADNWYPSDIRKRALIDSVLDWHHSHVRRGAAPFFFNTTLAPAWGMALNPKAAADAEKTLTNALSKIESFWLKGPGPFLLGNSEPSIADLSLVCELMQLEVVDEEDRDRILSPHKKVLQWIEDTKLATQPLFDELHEKLLNTKPQMKEYREAGRAKLAATS